VKARFALSMILALASAAPAGAQGFQVQDVPAVSAHELAQLKPRTILFSDRPNGEMGDSGTGLIKFEDWARARPVQKQVLAPYPSYVEPTINVVVHGQTKRHKEKLHIYVAEARFMLAKPAASIDLSRYVNLAFLERIDPSIKHRQISSADVVPQKNPEEAHNRHPQRSWCGAGSLCIESRYALEGRLPMGIRLANRIEESSGKQIAEYMEFQSELRLVPKGEIDQAAFANLTGLSTPVVGALEQSIFHVNQMMQWAKFLAVLQPHPSDPGKTIATAFMVLAIETDVLEKKKEFESVPVLRNLVPSQVLMGNSSFNTGTSISAGLPNYARNRIQAVAAAWEKD